MKSRIFKIAVGATLAIYIARTLGLQFYLAAGVIVILSLGETKRSSWSLALVRLKANVLALALGALSFYALGFSPLAFGGYLLLFLPLAFKFGLADGIVVNSVLVTHMLTVRSYGWPILLNSFALMAIGASLALILNSMMPNMVPQIMKDQEAIEAGFKDILLFLSAKIRRLDGETNERELFEAVKQLLEAAKIRAGHHQDNYLTRDFGYYSEYMAMRFLQFEVMARMNKMLDEIEMTVQQGDLVAGVTEEMAWLLHEYNNGATIRGKVEWVLGICRQMELPKTRQEFENRARLFSYLEELRHFIEIKQEFMKDATMLKNK